jgi:hypothetical protein
MTSKMTSKAVASATDAANDAALGKLIDVAKANAEFTGYMRFNTEVTFWQVMDADLEEGMLTVCRHIYVQVPLAKCKDFERENPCAKRMVGSNRERLAAFCKKNDLPAPMGGTGNIVSPGHVEYQLLRIAQFEVSPSLLNKHGKCTLPLLKENAVVAVGFEHGTIRKEVVAVTTKGSMGTKMADVKVRHRRIVAFVPEDLYEVFEIPMYMDKRDDTSDRGDIAFFE